MRYSVVYRPSGERLYREKFFSTWDNMLTFYANIKDGCDVSFYGVTEQPVSSASTYQQ